MIVDPGDLVSMNAISTDLSVIYVQVATFRLRGAPDGQCLQLNVWRDGSMIRVRGTDCQPHEADVIYRARDHVALVTQGR